MKPWYDRLHEKFASTSIHKEESTDDIRKWRKYINHFDPPADNIELSYIRYLCRMYCFSFPKKLVMNLFGLAALPIELYFILTARDSNHVPRKNYAVIERARDIPDYSDVVPEMIFDEYRNIETINNYNNKFGKLNKRAKKKLLHCMKTHPLSFFYIYFVYMELVTHSYIIDNYNPETTFVYINERNIASPIITELYEDEGRRFCSFMHGEYPLQLMTAFMKFSEYYVWDNTYIDMFQNDLHCDIETYHVYVPKKLQKKWELEKYIPEYDFTYYFSGESSESVRKVAELFIKLNSQGKKCSVRPHPRDMLHRKLLEDTFKNTDIPIEDATSLSLHDSLARTKYVIGLQSTVLSEAYVEGKQIVLDDISDTEHYELLKAQKFIMFSKKHKLFSEIINN